MLLRAKTALAGRVPSPNPDGSTSGNNTAEPAAIPAPARSFLSYNVPPARSVSTSTISASTTNVGLGLSIPAPAANSSQGNNYAASIAASANNAQNWEPGSHYTTSAAQQQAAPYGWVLAPVSPTQQQQQQPQLQTQQQPQQQTDAWGTSIRPPPPPPPSTQAQQQQQTSSQPPSIQPIQPIQTDPTIHTYKSGGSSTLSTSTPAPTVVGASDRPVTSQGRWNQAAGAGSVAGGGGAPVQPDGGW